MSFPLDVICYVLCYVIQLVTLRQKSVRNTVRIYVSANTGRTLAVNVEPKCDIKYVKKIIAPKLSLEPNELKIIFAGKELSDATIIEECDLGQKSRLHAVRVCAGKKSPQPVEPSKPLCETLVDLQLQNEERATVKEQDRERSKAHFFVHCAECKRLCKGKLRVRCSICKGCAFTVDRDPECWNDVLKPRRITGRCESRRKACTINEKFAEFYFKCAEHVSEAEKDFAVPLDLIRLNMKDVPCLGCTDIKKTILVFPCASKHVMCIECFQRFCRSRLSERKFVQHPVIGYTLSCPVGCGRSFIEEVHHFKLLSTEEYERYKRYAAEEFVLQSGGVLCPQPGCGMGLLVDEGCKKLTCQNGCGYVFCRDCLQGYHLGDCLPSCSNTNASCSHEYTVDRNRAASARWDEESRVTIRLSTKPCPKCRTPTERDGGCMHMLCSRPGCGFEWCWLCQGHWTRECMGAHWFDYGRV